MTYVRSQLQSELKSNVLEGGFASQICDLKDLDLLFNFMLLPPHWNLKPSLIREQVSPAEQSYLARKGLSFLS